ncbi:MAG: MBL fold metallo-hydrolase [Gammaproteobacteria bacterium]|nr:MBL fold metallo-hydrolase [Gammaproteobacteria bacterium]
MKRFPKRALTLGTVLLLNACGDAEPLSPLETADDGRAAVAACTPNIIPNYSPGWTPLPAASRLDIGAEVQAARDRVLGPDATDPAQVKLWWFGVASFVASMGGHLFLLDAWEIVGIHANYAPMTREDLAAIKPDAIFIGHGHFDHAADMGYVAGRSGAAVVGGEATCALAREQAARDGNEGRFPCLVLGDTAVPAPGTVQRLKVWEDMADVSALRHIHSSADPADLAAGGTPLVFVPEVLAYLSRLNTDPQEIAWFVESIDDEGGVGQPTGGAWAYHFRVGDFTLLWHDSAGPIAEGKNGAEDIQCALETLPGCVDVHSGAIVSFGSLTSGLRDARLYVEHSHPRLSMPNHHDAWFPALGPGAESYEAQWRAEIAKLAHPPELDYLNDPDDYLRPRSFRVDDPLWKVPMAGSACSP